MSILDTQLPFGAKLLKLLDRAPSGRFEFFALLLPGNDVPQVSPRNPGSLRKSPVFSQKLNGKFGEFIVTPMFGQMKFDCAVP
jgi:hypothetical protein